MHTNRQASVHPTTSHRAEHHEKPVASKAGSSADGSLATVSRLPAITQVEQNGASGKGGGALRPIDQKFEVNPSNGTLALNLPFSVTKSRSDLNPTLNLSYNSGAGNGVFGLGWHLPTESVTRKTSKEIPRYDESDTFLLSGFDDLATEGNPFAYTGALGSYTVQRYCPRVTDTQTMRIERFTQNDGDNVFWRTISADNVTKLFGLDAQSQILEETKFGHARIFSWLLCAVFDPLGNAMQIFYKSENDGGLQDADHVLPIHEGRGDRANIARAKYIKSIKYGNVTPARDLETWQILPDLNMAWMFEVIVDYGDHDAQIPTTKDLVLGWPVRQDSFSSCTSGFELRTHRLCRRLLLFHHFPGDLPLDDYLVRSYDFVYNENPRGSLLQSLTAKGYMWDKQSNQYVTQSIAPYEFGYSKVSDLKSLQTKTMKPECLQTLPVQLSKSRTRWLDLNGEGAPGLLVQFDGAWYYQRNEGALGLVSDDSDTESDSAVSEGYRLNPSQDLGPVQLLNSCPSLGDFGDSYFEDLDGNGLQDLVVRDGKSQMDGYYECKTSDQWENFREFPSLLSFDPNDPSMRRFDLTGNGRRDVLRSMGDGIAWYASLGKEGFSSERACEGADGVHMLLSQDQRGALYIVDATGDGLLDLVHISNGRVSYCPNLGHGRFGKEIVMGNSPMFDSDDQFTIKRLHLLDIDGSGTTDMVYLRPDGGALAYFNFCGNFWSEAVSIAGFPQIDELSSVFTLDLLGNGTSCLCWAGTDGAKSNALIVYYLDLCEGTKPHVLESWSNGTGLRASAKYSPSTKLYLQDERAGRPWKTKLPFPVHVVSRLKIVDDIVSSTQTTKYRYHDGYYDGREKEFRGFGMVEMWTTEDFAIMSGKRFQKPTSYTKHWYHTGAEEIGLKTSDVETYSPSRLQSAIPPSFDARFAYDVFRSLKGRLLRVEIYGLDQSDTAAVPYTIAESSYDVTFKVDDSGHKTPLLRVMPREILKTSHERQEDDVHVEHELMLETNAYGDVTKVLHAQYGKLKSELSTIKARAAQQLHYITYTEHSFTKDVNGSDPDNYCKPLPVSKTISVIEGSTTTFLDMNTLRLQGLQSIGGTIKSAQQSRTYYRSQDLSMRLPLGSREVFSVVDQDYQLALDFTMLSNLLAPKDLALRRIVLPDHLYDRCGYKQMDKDDLAWVASAEVLWGDEGTTDGISILRQARRRFLTPTRSRDAFGNPSSVELDKYTLMAVKSTDAVNNVTSAKYDYRTTQATLLTDRNGNRTEIKHDLFGEATIVARMGKVHEALGDSLENVPQVVADEDILSFITSPTRSFAVKLLGTAAIRTLSCRSRLAVPSAQKTLPTFRVDLARTQHFRDGQGGIAVNICYRDGLGSDVQNISLNDWDSTGDKWSVTLHKVLDSSGKSLLSAKPYHSSDHLYQSHVNSNQAFDISFVDVLQREIGTLFADRTWKKSCFLPWKRLEYDVGNNTLVSDPRLDAHVGYYFTRLATSLHTPSWHTLRMQGDEAQRDAATKSAEYANFPREFHLDSRGKEVETVENGKTGSRKSQLQYDAFGNTIAEVDFRGRDVVTREYDLLGRCYITRSMDAGVELKCLDSTDNIAFQCSSNGYQKRIVYDKLRREIETWSLDPKRNSEILWSKTTYGDKCPGGEEQNLRGQVLEVSDQVGTHRNTAFDFKGNCLSTEIYIAQVFDDVLDWNGSVEVQQTPHTTTRTFDAINRVQTLTDGAGQTSTRTFDLSGNLLTLFTSTKKEPSIVTWHVTSAIYTVDQQPLLVNYGNSSHAAYTYDEQTHRLTRRRVWRDDGTMLEDARINYDCLGRATRKVDVAHQTQFFRGTQVAPRREYWYDSFGRLVKATGRETVQTGSNVSRSQQVVSPSSEIVSQALPFAESTALSNYVETYTYDDADNILSMQHHSADPEIPDWKRTYQYNEPSLLGGPQPNNRLSQTQIGGDTESYKYDGDAGAVGCMTFMPGFSRLGWDGNNKLRCSARQRVNKGVPETTWYVYSKAGRRMRKVVARTVTDESNVVRVQKAKETIFLDSLEIYHTYSGDGQTVKRTTNTSLINPTGSAEDSAFLSIEVPIPTAEEFGGQTTPLFRYHINENLETDDDGQVISYEEYSPFGVSVLLACRAAVEAPRRYRFAAYQRDNETGLFVCGDRYYAPWLGRWTSADPIGTGDGHNIYAYVHNDPVNYVDPTGNLTLFGEGGIFGRKSKSGEGKKDRREGFTGSLPLQKPEDTLKMAKMITAAEKSAKPLLAQIQQELNENKEEYATAVVKALLGEAAGLIPIAGPAVKTVVNKLVDIYANKKKKEKELKEEIATYLSGFADGLKVKQAEFEKMVMDNAGKDLHPTEKLDKIVTSALGTSAIDATNNQRSQGDEYDLKYGTGNFHSDEFEAGGGPKTQEMAERNLMPVQTKSFGSQSHSSPS
ncbi:SpvB-domain-containing protein [Pyrenochaeta sp. DS3sAY3a]|nr:SpvB-domain-containing protein [Pyrenochaeta sp. DS3sAY3a]